ncbi:hypothetical protein [Halobacillus sp. KGW1]|uniref:hypothetical protein n=1 Tax=Halobacillus sp. KGW1 TaxID=1793726 RepID=UPI000784DCF0|nr:hypothetical protein [Halobacillus sp. KGW1]
MLIPIVLGLLTILSVALALRRKRPIFLLLPLAGVLATSLVKIIQVPMPFWETIQFIFDLRG